MSARADKRDAAHVGADKTPTKQSEETNEAADAPHANAQPEPESAGRKKTRGELFFSNATGRSYAR